MNKKLHTKKMNKSIKKKWINALLSGEYKQGQYNLRSSELQHGKLEQKFCCLGVLCDLHSKETGKRWKRYLASVWRYNKMDGLPPKNVQEWSGLDNIYVLERLANMNDNRKSFKYIAAYIKRYL